MNAMLTKLFGPMLMVMLAPKIVFLVNFVIGSGNTIVNLIGIQ